MSFNLDVALGRYSHRTLSMRSGSINWINSFVPFFFNTLRFMPNFGMWTLFRYSKLCTIYAFKIYALIEHYLFQSTRSSPNYKVICHICLGRTPFIYPLERSAVCVPSLIYLRSSFTNTPHRRGIAGAKWCFPPISRRIVNSSTSFLQTANSLALINHTLRRVQYFCAILCWHKICKIFRATSHHTGVAM